MSDAFLDAMQAGYGFADESLTLGSPLHDGKVETAVRIRLALGMANRHGLIAGATGTGKTKTLQVLAGELSDVGVPVFAVDVKGDVSGVGAAGDATNAKVVERAANLAWTYEPKAHPIELLSLSGQLGAPVRATVHSFGPLLLAKVLGLNDTQTSVLGLVFRYCDDRSLPLLDLADLRTTLKYLGSDEGKADLDDIGGMSSATLGVILRAIVTLESGGGGDFFGEPEFDVDDLIRTGADGRGVITLLELADVMDRPVLFSTFTLWLLAQLYTALPEVGDLDKPKLCFFFDEAHLLFDDASDALLEQIERTARLIRSKGVGVYFVTQAPTDVPSAVLAQLGNRIQHALRAFTPEDADDLRKVARTFPITEFYDVEKTITSLGIGEALVTVLSPSGVPTPLAATRLLPPDSRMAPLTDAERAAAIAASTFQAKYGTAVDRESAHEIITGRIESAKAAAAEAAAAGAAADGDGAGTPRATRREIEAQIKRDEKERREAERELRAEERARRADERARQRMVETGVRTAGRIITSRAGQNAIRDVFGTLFGRRR